jgi:hypothetical protein
MKYCFAEQSGSNDKSEGKAEKSVEVETGSKLQLIENLPCSILNSSRKNILSAL